VTCGSTTMRPRVSTYIDLIDLSVQIADQCTEYFVESLPEIPQVEHPSPLSYSA
jgi:hypothetical protein